STGLRRGGRLLQRRGLPRWRRLGHPRGARVPVLPQRLPSMLLPRFFRVFARWKWPSPVMLCAIEHDDGELGLKRHPARHHRAACRRQRHLPRDHQGRRHVGGD
ncbi:Os08g0278750, partial [Oryza sativa Japonica Group]